MQPVSGQFFCDQAVVYGLQKSILSSILLSVASLETWEVYVYVFYKDIDIIS